MTESDIVRAVAAHRVPHPTDTHPPTVERLLTLGVQPEDAAKNLALPAEPSISLFDAPEQMERILTGVQVKMLALKTQHATNPVATNG